MPRSKTRKVKKGNRKGNRKGRRKTIRGGTITRDTSGFVRRQVAALNNHAIARNERSNKRESVELLRNKQLIQERRSRFTQRRKKKSSSASDGYMQVQSIPAAVVEEPALVVEEPAVVVEEPALVEAPVVVDEGPDVIEDLIRQKKLAGLKKARGDKKENVEGAAEDVLDSLTTYLNALLEGDKKTQELADEANKVLDNLNAFLDKEVAPTLPSEKNNYTNSPNKSLTRRQLQDHLEQMNQHGHNLVEKQLELSPQEKVSWVKGFINKLLGKKKKNNLSTKKRKQTLYGGKR